MIEPAFRLMAPTDVNLVLSTWLKSYAKSQETRHDYCDRDRETREVIRDRRGQYFVDYEPVVKAILARSQVICACLPDTPDAVLGWMCIEEGTLHYVAVKSRWRGLGIAGKLLGGLEPMPLGYTHMTDHALEKLRIPDHWHFRPHRRYAS